jgi:hypothetical protein
MSDDTISINPDEEAWLFDQRNLWPGQFADRGIYEMIRLKEEQLLRGKALGKVSTEHFEKFIRDLSTRYPKWFEGGKIIDSYNYSVFLPYSQGVFQIIKLQSTHIVIFGDWGTGKTISAWTIAYILWHYLREIGEGCEIHVWGDADALVETIKTEAAKTGDAELIAFANDLEEHLEPPSEETWPKSTKKKIMIFNEMNEEGNSRRFMSTANIQLAMKIWKERHSGEYPIFNVITPTSLDLILRGGPVRIYHHTSLDNTLALERLLPPSWRCIADETTQLREGEAIAIYSLYPYTKKHKGSENLSTAIDIVRIIPPPWLLEMVKLAKFREAEHGLKITYASKSRKGKKEKKEVQNPDIWYSKKKWFHIDYAEGRRRHPRLNFKKVLEVATEWIENGVPINVACADIGIGVSTIKALVNEKILVDDRFKTENR